MGSAKKNFQTLLRLINDHNHNHHGSHCNKYEDHDEKNGIRDARSTADIFNGCSSGLVVVTKWSPNQVVTKWSPNQVVTK